MGEGAKPDPLDKYPHETSKVHSMDSAKAPQSQPTREEYKQEILRVLSTFPNTIMSSDTIVSLMDSQFTDKSLTGSVLYQLALVLSGPYEHIQNTSRGHYVYSETLLPKRADVPSQKDRSAQRTAEERRKRLLEQRRQDRADKRLADNLHHAEKSKAQREIPEAVEVKEAVKEPTSIIIEGAPNFTFVGKIGGRYIVRNEKGTLYVLQPAELA
jgi:hypothetical protein